MDYKTYNYQNLEDKIKTSAEADKLAVVTFEPSVIIDRVDDLMNTFSELYLDSEESYKSLKFDIEQRPNAVISLFYSIWVQVKDVVKMLNECQEFEPKQAITLPQKTA